MISTTSTEDDLQTSMKSSEKADFLYRVHLRYMDLNYVVLIAHAFFFQTTKHVVF